MITDSLYLRYIFTLFLLVNGTNSVFSQPKYTKDADETVRVGQVVVLRLNDYVGEVLQWQGSQDSQNWSDFQGAGADTLVFEADQTTYFRISVISGHCDPFYSDTILIVVYHPASATTADVKDITHESAISGGNVTDDGGATVTARGVVWSTSQNPTIDNNEGMTNDGVGTGEFASSIAGLTPGTIYYYRAYATNSAGTAYGFQMQFTTDITVPHVTTSDIKNIAATSATGGGNVASDGGSTVTTRGVVWSTTQNPTLENNMGVSVDGQGTGEFISYLTGLKPGTRYYVRAYATNPAGTSYGFQVAFITDTQMASVSTANVTNITSTTATSGGNATDDGGAAVTARGVVWSTSQNPTINNNEGKTINGGGTGEYTSQLTNLRPGTSYFVRAYATNSVGTVYGNELQFFTEVQPASLTTATISNITANAATSGGNITSAGGANVTSRGVVWDTTQNPTIENNLGLTNDGSGKGEFTSQITGLEPFKTYYIRAYAINIAGISYGDQKQFATDAGRTPTINTDVISDITTTSALAGGNVTDQGDTPVSARGVCWSTQLEPTLNNNHTIESGGLGGFSTTISGLNPATAYFVRAYATNVAGTSYGEQRQFISDVGRSPSVNTGDVIDIASTSAVGVGNVTDSGDTPISVRGICWGTQPEPNLNSNYTVESGGSGAFTSNISGLNPVTTYYVRAYATNQAGTSYGSEKQFTTKAQIATVTTSAISSIKSTSAVGGGIVVSDGGSVVTQRGICWSTSTNPTLANNYTTDNSGVGSFSSLIADLTPKTTYYVRAYATNGIGVSYGNQMNFTTTDFVCGDDIVIDVDGNIYTTVRIGNQCWMKENLKTTKYRDGTAIDYPGTNNSVWIVNNNGAYAWYDNDVKWKDIYGALYNWHAVTNSKGLCPLGWRVPTDKEWTDLISLLGGSSHAGLKLKSTRTDPDPHPRWNSSNYANNESNFSAFPGGYRNRNDGDYHNMGWLGLFWSSTSDHGWFAWKRVLDNLTRGVLRTESRKEDGLSVRCIRDN